MTDEECTGARTIAGRMRRFRIGNECGEVFEADEDFDGHTLTVELTDARDGENLLRILAGWEPIADDATVEQVARAHDAEECDLRWERERAGRVPSDLEEHGTYRVEGGRVAG